MKFSNPIVAGFYPDPSICKYNDTYYMVHSTFQYFPGVTLFESRDLIHWLQIGHVLTRESQLPLRNAHRSEGIFAPTIRCYEGRFYMVTTNVSSIGNFYVYTDNIYGEWSDPILVEQDGIDPSLYFEDGICYFMSNGTDAYGEHGVIQCEIDITTGKKLSESKCIWKGTGGRYLESPHLYKINGSYYLMAAEGGTEYGHMVILAKGDTPYGPFVNAPNNPILTNRNLGGYEIQGCGHGDLIEDNYGNWWMVHLAFRQTGRWNMIHITGRETYLVPVTIEEDGWIKVGTDGTTREEYDLPQIDLDRSQILRRNYTFANTTPGVEWCYLRNPHMEKYNLSKETFELLGTKERIEDDLGTPTFIAIRQCEMNGYVTCKVEVKEQEAGITMYMDNIHHYDLLVKKTELGLELQKRICIGDIIYVQQKVVLEKEDVRKETILESNGIYMDNEKVAVRLGIRFTPTTYYFEVEYKGEIYDFGHNDTRYISTEVASGFTGVMIGLYAQGDGLDCMEAAKFTNFECRFER